MKLDEDDYARNVKLNAYGQVDVDYYRAKAVEMRAEMIAEMVHYAIDSGKAIVQAIYTRLVGFKSQPSH